MSSGTTIPNLGTPPPADPEAYYQQLYDSLRQAYYSAATIEDKDTIFDTREDVYVILTGIAQAKLDADTAKMTALGDLVAKNNTDLEKLKASIDKIVTDTQAAANLENSIAQVLSVASSFL